MREADITKEQIKKAALVKLKHGAKGYLTIRGFPLTNYGCYVSYLGKTPGNRVVLHLFKSIPGQWLMSVTSSDFETGSAVFTKEPVYLYGKGRSNAKKGGMDGHVEGVMLHAAMAKLSGRGSKVRQRAGR